MVLVMLITAGAIVGEIVPRVYPWWVSWVSLALAGSGMVSTLGRTVPNARRLGGARDTPATQSAVAVDVARFAAESVSGLPAADLIIVSV